LRELAPEHSPTESVEVNSCASACARALDEPTVEELHAFAGVAAQDASAIAGVAAAVKSGPIELKVS
jgi:hypothetical protein